MATVTLTVGAGTQQWTPPIDCVTIDKIELWGPGGSGAQSTGSRTTGGGAGAYNAITGPITVASLLVSGTIPYETGQRGAAVNGAVGNPGTAKTWFSAIGTYAADFGRGGITGASGTTAGGIGGAVANCVPIGAASTGGSGGTCSNAGGASGGGASPSAAGPGVTAAAVTTAAAGAGTTAPAGGGNGGAGSITVNGGDGLAPGGGGGASRTVGSSSGRGGNGQIIITYTPNTGLQNGTATIAATGAAGAPALGILAGTANVNGIGQSGSTATAILLETANLGGAGSVAAAARIIIVDVAETIGGVGSVNAEATLIPARAVTIAGVGSVGSVYSLFSADFSSDFGGGGFGAVRATTVNRTSGTISGVASVSVPATVVARFSGILHGAGAVNAGGPSAAMLASALIPGIGRLSGNFGPVGITQFAQAEVIGSGQVIGFPGVHLPGRVAAEPDIPPPLKIPSIPRHSAGSAAARTDGPPAIARRAGLHRSAA